MTTMTQTEKEREAEKQYHTTESGNTLGEWVKWIVITTIVFMLGIPFFMEMASRATGAA